MKKRLTILLCASVVALGSTTASAALIDTGDGTIYDSDQNLTWMQNANVNVNNGFNGKMSWSDANAWAENLVFAGHDDWRLPTTMEFDDPSCLHDARGSLFYEHHVGCTGGEMEKLTVQLYDGNYPSGDLNAGPFINIQTETRYWTATPYRDADENGVRDGVGIDPCIFYPAGYDVACNLPNDNGRRIGFYWQWSFVGDPSVNGPELTVPYKTTLAGGNIRYAWAVRTGGSSTTVPLPASIWLVGSGLISVFGISSRRGKGVTDARPQ